MTLIAAPILQISDRSSTYWRPIGMTLYSPPHSSGLTLTVDWHCGVNTDSFWTKSDKAWTRWISPLVKIQSHRAMKIRPSNCWISIRWVDWLTLDNLADIEGTKTVPVTQHLNLGNSHVAILSAEISRCHRRFLVLTVIRAAC